MRVLICHERFIGRYGADRVLVILARALRAAGAHVTLLGARIDAEAVAGAADRLVLSPLDVAARDLDERTAQWLSQHWAATEPAGGSYDLVVVGGWPFFSAIPYFRSVADRVLFIDCGVVPGDGYAPPMRSLLEHLVALRRTFLPACTHLAANSEFTLRSQSIPDAGPAVRCQAILNGVDHLPVAAAGDAGAPPPALAALRAQHRPAVLLLGRYEPVGYKDSGAALRVLSAVHQVDRSLALVVLEPPDRLAVPGAMAADVFGIGYPTDAELVQVMRACVVGWSVSRWEGFNLPLAEMFWLDRPALAFDLAAHPEVVPDPWFLARNEFDMAARTLTMLTGPGVTTRVGDAARTAWRARFTWRRFVDQIITLVELPR